MKNFCVGARDSWSYPKFLCGCKMTRGDIPNFCVGVRDSGRYLEFLCGCKRPGEVSRISVWV